MNSNYESEAFGKAVSNKFSKALKTFSSHSLKLEERQLLDLPKMAESTKKMYMKICLDIEEKAFKAPLPEIAI